MSLEQLTAYIKNERLAGKTDEVIRATLIQNGWGVTMIKEGFGRVEVESNQTFGGNLTATNTNRVVGAEVSINSSPNSNLNGSEKLEIVDDPYAEKIPSAFGLLRESLVAFGHHWWQIMLGGLLIVGLQALSGYILQMMNGKTMNKFELAPLSMSGSDIIQFISSLFGVGLIFGLFIVVITVLVGISYFYLIAGNGRIGLINAYSKSFLKIGPVIWTHVLALFVISGGVVLLLIPGILFSLWYVAAHIVVLTDNVSGSEALKRSKFYVRKKLGVIIERNIVLGLMAALIYLPLMFTLGLLSENKEVLSIVNIVFSIVQIVIMTPLSLIFEYKLFGYVKLITENEEGEYVSSGGGKSIVFFAFIGILVSISWIASMVIAFGNGFSKLTELDSFVDGNEELRDNHIVLTTTLVQVDMKDYYVDHGEYPDSFNDTIPNYIQREPVDVTTGEPYEYTYIRMKKGASYRYCIRYNLGADQKCIGPKINDSDTDKNFTSDEENDLLNSDPTGDSSFR